MKPDEDQPPPQRLPVATWIMVAVLAWGAYLAIGAVRFGGTLAIWRGLIVFVCTLAFLGVWWLALAVRQRRVRANDKT